MGMYDTVLVPCPKCNRKAVFQSKGGDCFLRYYELERAPEGVMEQVNNHSPVSCRCGESFYVGKERKVISLTDFILETVEKLKVITAHDIEDTAPHRYEYDSAPDVTLLVPVMEQLVASGRLSRLGVNLWGPLQRQHIHVTDDS